MQGIIASALFISTTAATANGGACPGNPPGMDDSCASKSAKLGEWTVKDFDFHKEYLFTNPAHQNSHGYVNFVLQNAAAGSELVCSATSSWLDVFFLGERVYRCTGPDGEATDDATFTYNDPTRELLINQTWSCNGGGAKYFARGGVKLDLDCEETKYKNPDWKGNPGEIYSNDTTACDFVTVAAKIDSVQKLV